MDIAVIDIIGFLTAGLLVAAIVAVPLLILSAIRTALRKPKPMTMEEYVERYPPNVLEHLYSGAAAYLIEEFSVEEKQ